MSNIKINTIALCLILLLRFGEATRHAWPLEYETEHEIFLAGKAPVVGEVFEVVYRVRLKPDIQPEFGRRNFYIKFDTGTAVPVEVIDKDEIIVPYLIPGEWREFRGRFRISKPYKVVYVTAKISPVSGSYTVVGASLGLRLIDAETGQYGTGEEWFRKAANVLWKYNHLDAQWLSEPDPRWEASNRKIVEEMRKFEPALTDSEALCLHQDNYLLIISAIGDSCATDSERVEYLLKAGWLEAQRAGAEAKEQWLNNFMEKHRRRWGGNSEFNMLYLK